MKYVDEYRDTEEVQKLVKAINRITTQTHNIMEVCGGHTHAIMSYGIDKLLPMEITLMHGPGCPVCVTPTEVIDKAIEVASHSNVIFCSFGDMLRVPGTEKDLLSAPPPRTFTGPGKRKTGPYGASHPRVCRAG